MQYNPNIIDIPQNNMSNMMQNDMSYNMNGGVQNGMNGSMQFQMPNIPMFKQEEKGGTSILELKKRKQMNENSSQSSHSNYSHPSQFQENHERDRIKSLVRDINKSLDNYAPPQTNYTDFDEDSIIDFDDVNTDNDNNIISNNIEEHFNNSNKKSKKWDISLIIKEVLLIVIIYVILSQPYVRNHIERYVPLRGSNGSISVVGFALYGIVLGVIYVILNRLLLK